MVYHSVTVSLSSAQSKKLASGDNIRLKHAQLTGVHTIFVTNAQLKQIEKAKAKGKGLQLHFTGEQIKHNSKSGSGIFDFLKGAAEKVLPVLIEKGVEIAKDKGAELLDKGFKKGVDILADKGTQMMKRGRGRPRKGDGLFSWIPGGVGAALDNIGNKVVDVGLPIATNMALNRLTKGRGLKAPGY